MHVLALYSALLLGSLPAQVPYQSAVDEYIQDRMRTLHIPGLSLGVAYKGAVYKKAWGVADLERGTPAATDTLYEIASISKPLLAAAVVLLARDQKPLLRLDERVRKYVPDLPVEWEGITIRHLLTHTSGLKEYLNMGEFSLRRDYSDRELVDLASHYPLNFPPGDQFEYTNTGYCVLAMVVERVTNRTYGDILNERVFSRLKMKSTRVNDSTAIIPKRAVGYAYRFGEFRHADFVTRSQLAFADCGILSDVDDLLAWDKEMWNQKSVILPRDLLEETWTRGTLNGGARTSYGLGWDLFPATGGLLVAHGGAIEGFRSVIFRYLADELTVIVLLNAELDVGVNYDLAQGVANLVVGNAPGARALPRIDTRALRARRHGH